MTHPTSHVVNLGPTILASTPSNPGLQLADGDVWDATLVQRDGGIPMKIRQTFGLKNDDIWEFVAFCFRSWPFGMLKNNYTTVAFRGTKPIF